ncbi:hypothetical protein [Glutamicibacter sp. M10]|uniref:hypothetical protein n=1 Tax=Glutamicibacter sp. M10 TaxID=3023076 RepID=UPI0021C653DE|nr:hypothetical protein [Glutamicibacter sp. M10]UXN31026.1 hypothetical protein N6V40_11405 [Glutamicibacter sp. M10]
MKKLFPLAVLASLALSGCGSTASDAPSSTEPSADAQMPSGENQEVLPAEDLDTPELMEAGAFKLLAMSGADISFDLPTPTTDKRLSEIEAYRKDTGADPVTYLIAEVDNRKGTEFVNMYEVSAYDEEGNKYEFSTVSEHISEWGPTYTADYEYVMPDGSELSETEGQALNNRGVDLHNKFLDGVDPAERGTIVMLSEDVDLPSEFTRVAVHPSGGMNEAEEAFPASWENAD